MNLNLQDVEWSNADEVEYFLDNHKGFKFAVGDALTLPDIGQEYTVAAARPFRKEGRMYLYLDLVAECAVDGCHNTFGCTVDTGMWRNKPHLKRCCADHRYGFHTTMPGAWWLAARREEEVRAEDLRRLRKAAAADRRRGRGRRGVVERAVMAALSDLKVVTDTPTDDQIVRLACPRLSVPLKRDTRKQNVTRCLASLRRRGLLFAPTGAT